MTDLKIRATKIINRRSGSLPSGGFLYKQIVIYGGMQRISSLKLRFRGWIT